MTPAQQILKLIENVDPADTGKLDEIDARVGCYLLHINPDEMWQGTSSYPAWKDPSFRGYHYTRSRDALKAIRPYGWTFSISSNGDCIYFSNGNGNNKIIAAGNLPTEELAELSAVIQAIEYERGEK